MPRTIHEMNLDTFIGLKIREYRITKKMSQGELAEKIGIAFQQVQKYERAMNRVSVSRLCTISEILNVPITKFLPKERTPKVDPIEVLYCDRKTLVMAREFNQIKNPKIQSLIVNMIRELKKA